MKKIMSILIAVLLVASLAACQSPANVQTPAGEQTAADTAAPADPTEAPADPTEAPADPTEAPADPLIEAAWPIAEKIAQVHNVTVSAEGSVSYHSNTGAETASVVFNDGADDPLTVITVNYEKDGDDWTETGETIALYIDEQPDPAKWESDFAALEWPTVEVSAAEVKELAGSLAGTDDEQSFAAMAAASKLSDLYLFCAEDNYFRCELAFSGSLKMKSDGLFALKFVVKPVNERYFAAAYGDFMGPLNKSERQPDTDYLFTLDIDLVLEKTDSGSYTVTFTNPV